MDLFHLATRNIRRNAFRSFAIFLIVTGVVGLLVSSTLLISGVNYSLNSGLKRLGADLLVVPIESASQIDTALLMGKPTKYSIPESDIQKVAEVPGVAATSAQVYLSTLYGAGCCSFSETFLVVFDPATDFTMTPWLKSNLGRPLAKDEIIGGSGVSVPQGSQQIMLYGYGVNLAGNLEPTGTGMDQTIFMTMETAQDIANSSLTTAEQPLKLTSGQVSAVLVKVSPGADAHKVALGIYKNTTDAAALESPNLFGTYRQQISGLLWGFVGGTVILWAMAMILIGLVFSVIAGERRREMAVRRAIGAKRNFIMRTMLAEAAILAAGGALLGIFLASSLLYLFKDFISGSLRMPFLFPSAGAALELFAIGLVLAVVTIIIAVSIPAFRVSRQELAIAMRE